MKGFWVGIEKSQEPPQGVDGQIKKAPHESFSGAVEKQTEVHCGQTQEKI